MNNNLKKFFDVFTDLLLWFILGVATIKALDLANFLMTYPNDIAFFAGLLIYTISIGAIGYAIYSILNNQKQNKNEN
jgi:hypothetical protein